MRRLDYASVSKDDFIQQVEKPNVPAVIVGGLENWNARAGWTYEVEYRQLVELRRRPLTRVVCCLHQNLLEQYRDVKFKCGEDDDGYPVCSMCMKSMCGCQ